MSSNGPDEGLDQSVDGCAVCGLPAARSHHGASFCADCIDRVISEVGPGPEQLPVVRCGRCGGWCARHDDVIPWRCTVCKTTLKESETETQLSPGVWTV